MVDTVFSANAIRSAYSSSQGLTALPTEAEQAGKARESFADMVREAASDAASTVRESDRTVQQSLTGNVGTQQVVEATIAMESTVKIAVAMRDKLVQAYQEVMRMPI